MIGNIMQSNDKPETVTLEAYSLFEFCQKVQDAIQAGYEFDFTKNETVPVAMGSYLFSIMRLKPVVAITPQSVVVVTPESEPVAITPQKTEEVVPETKPVKTKQVKQAEVKAE